ncbi:LAME_0D06436g1_1 [Lachancea meyersii CBS 8951]|uniref:LAME_0D06436g1_1 n=1 Tax=Lachancea meyersii CBS 8951 TaxID=1266667 RepID=A0A1G4J9N3_9SACH|nr:LAME_0D06436g1_1 [Lachancea meyersii CBS 8951]
MSPATDGSLYEVLGVSNEASKSEIKKAYRAKALQLHPDKNGHSEAAKLGFQKVSEAYRVLQDDNKRAMYDRFGTSDESQWPAMQAAESPRGSTGMSAGDLFAQFFGGGTTTAASSFFNSNMDFFGRHSRAPRSKSLSHGPDIKHSLKCTLEELYQGKNTKLALNRTRLCRSCEGKGALKMTTCKMCNGCGMQTQTRRQGPVTQSWSSTCSGCGGQGTLCKPEDTCTACQGQGYIGERKIFDITIEKGMESGQELILPGEADEVINTNYGSERVIPGDVIIVVEQSFHSRYKRHRDSSLILEKFPVGLKTSLCGGPVWIDSHPSGKKIKINVIPGEVLKPGALKSVENLGMPNKRGGFGNLYIEFEVIFPKTMDAKTLKAIEPILDRDENVQEVEKQCQKPPSDTGSVEEHVLSDFVPNLDKRRSGEEDGNSRKRNRRSRSRSYDDDEFAGY